MIQFQDVEQFKISMEAQNGVFVCNTPDMLQSNLNGKKLAVQRCILSNSFVPLFIFDMLDVNSPDRLYSFPDGSVIKLPTNPSNMLIGLRVMDQVTEQYTYSGGYLNFDASKLNGGSTNKLDADYYSCFDIYKLCSYIAENIALEFYNFDLFSVILQYDSSLNVFVLNIIESLLSNTQVVVNKKFLEKFPFSATKITEDLFSLDFNQSYTSQINNIIYQTLTCIVPYNFIPFDSVIITSNMPTRPLKLYSNATQNQFVIQDTVIQTFDRLSSALNFYDYYIVDNSNILKFISFTSDSFPFSDVNFRVYLYNSNKNQKISVNIKNGSVLNFELLVYYL